MASQIKRAKKEGNRGVQVSAPQVVDSQGQVNWEQLKSTELGNYSFFNLGNYEFKAVLPETEFV